MGGVRRHGEFGRIESIVPEAMLILCCLVLHDRPDTVSEVSLKQEMQFYWPRMTKQRYNLAAIDVGSRIRMLLEDMRYNRWILK